MKVLIIEDSELKLEYTKRILNKHSITDIVHFNNLTDAVSFFEFSNIFSEIDFIILDMCFYTSRPDFKNTLNANAGLYFLFHLIEFLEDFEVYNPKKYVLVHSSEKNYIQNLERILYDIYLKGYQLPSSIKKPIGFSDFIEYYSKQILNSIFGNACNESELETLISDFISTQTNDKQ